MDKLQKQVFKIYKKAGFSHREIVQNLALICADGIAAMGSKGIKVTSDEIDILITIKVKK